jgi:hypothetical protein
MESSCILLERVNFIPLLENHRNLAPIDRHQEVGAAPIYQKHLLEKENTHKHKKTRVTIILTK